MLEMEILPFIDLEGGLKRVRGNKSLYLRMVKLFLAGTENDDLEAAVAAGDIPRASDVSHGIKGVTGNLSFTTLFEVSAKLNEKLKHGEMDDELMDQYRQAYKSTLECANRLVQELQ